MNIPEIVKLVERKDERIEALQREVTELREEAKRLREALEESLSHIKIQLAVEGVKYTGDPDVLNDHINHHSIVQLIEKALKK